MAQLSGPQPSVEEPLCSVCIANYNGIGFLGPCLESVLSQDFDHPLEIIVHDDASTDDSVAFIRSNFPQVRLLASGTNVGFCASNNRMAAASRGRFLLLLNNDATLFPDALQTLHDYALSQEKPGILGLPEYDMQTGELIDIGYRLDLFLNPIPNRDPSRRVISMITGACFWVPKSLWNELGGFPEFFGSLAEDLYLCCLARLRGCPVEAVPQSGFHHWMGRSFGGGRIAARGLQTTYRRRALSERNKMCVMIMCCPYPYSLILLPLYTVVLVSEGILISALKRDFRLWKEIYLRCLRELWDKRKQLAKSRRQVQRFQNEASAFFDTLVLIPQKIVLYMKHGLPYVG
jgi:GT2 family glycosyltransferase